MIQQPLAHASPPVLARFDPTGTDPGHQRCHRCYRVHAAGLATAAAGNGLPTQGDVSAFISSVQQRPDLDTTAHSGRDELVWVDPTYFVATPSYMDGWPAQRYGVRGFWFKTLAAGRSEHVTQNLWQDSMSPSEIEMSINGSELYMRIGSGGRHRWAAWKLLGFPAVPVVLVS